MTPPEDFAPPLSQPANLPISKRPPDTEVGRFFEPFLRRYKETVAFASVIFGVVGLVIAIVGVYHEQAKTMAEIRAEQERTATDQRKTVVDGVRVALEAGNNEMATLDLVSRYADKLKGFAYERTPEKGASARTSSDKATGLAPNNPSEAENLFHAAYTKFELNSAALESVQVVIDSLVTENDNGANTAPDSPNSAQRRASRVIAPLLYAQSVSFDPTERAAALSLCAHLFNGHGTLAVANSPRLKESFQRQFLGMIDFKNHPKNFTAFDFTGSNFFQSKFNGSNDNSSGIVQTTTPRGTQNEKVTQATERSRKASFAISHLGGTQFRECEFTNVTFAGADAPLPEKSKDTDISVNFGRGRFHDCPEFGDARFDQASFVQAQLFNVVFKQTKLNRADFTKATVENPPAPKATSTPTATPTPSPDPTAPLGNWDVASDGARPCMFDTCELVRAHFDQGHFTGATFLNCHLDRASFQDCALEKATFTSDPTHPALGVVFGTSHPDSFTSVDLTGSILVDLPLSADAKDADQNKKTLSALFQKDVTLDMVWLPQEAQPWFLAEGYRNHVKMNRFGMVFFFSKTPANGTTPAKVTLVNAFRWEQENGRFGTGCSKSDFVAALNDFIKSQPDKAKAAGLYNSDTPKHYEQSEAIDWFKTLDKRFEMGLVN